MIKYSGLTQRMKYSGLTQRKCKRFMMSFSLFCGIFMMFAVYQSLLPTQKIFLVKQQLPLFFTIENENEINAECQGLLYKTEDDMKVEQYNTFKGKYGGIPKIIHQIWRNDMIPEIFQENIKGLMAHNKPPEWQYFFWTDETGQKFLNDTYPSLLHRFSTAQEILKADILRLAVIYHYGGVYFDLDTISVKPLDSYVESHNCSFTVDPPEHFLHYYFKSQTFGKIITNSVILCRPKNWFIWHVMEQLFNQSETCTHAVNCTGPGIITKEYEKFQTTIKLFDLPPIEDYQLFTDKIAVKDISRFITPKCREILKQTTDEDDWRKSVCRDFVERGGSTRCISKRAYTYHTWFHIKDNHKRMNMGVWRPVKKIVPHVYFYNG